MGKFYGLSIKTQQIWELVDVIGNLCFLLENKNLKARIKACFCEKINKHI